MTEVNLFGRILTAMVTPFQEDGSLDTAQAQRVARFLTRPGWNDGLVLNGTTGESSTTTDQEKVDLIRAVRDAVGPGVPLIAGVGSADTRHSVAMAQAAAMAGADGIMIVTPYYSRPGQRGIREYFLSIADAVDLPVMLYNIPTRTGSTLTLDTIAAVAEHPRIVAMKDASGDIAAAAQAMEKTDLMFYSGEDALNLPLLSLGFVGVVSVVGHIAADVIREMTDAVRDGALDRAREAHRRLLPLASGMFRAPGAVSSKYALGAIGYTCGPVRSPYVELTAEESRLLDADMAAADIG